MLQDTIGWQRPHLRVNSLTPAIGLASTASTAAVFEPRIPHERSAFISDVQHAQPRSVPQRWSGMPADHRFTSVRPTWFAISQKSALRQVRTLRKLPEIVVTADADNYATTLRARDDVNSVLRLVLLIVPGACGAQVSVVHDMEDGTTNLRLRIRTSATTTEVLDAEDDLHDALFDRLRPATRSLFAVSYDFVTRQQWNPWTS